MIILYYEIFAFIVTRMFDFIILHYDNGVSLH
jgi:hypothetical protein